MPDPLPLTVVDAALRGTLLALLLLLAGALWRDRPRLPAAQAAIAFCLGLCVQVIGGTPLLEDRLPLAWQAPLIAVAVGNAVLFWVFVQALFDDDFVLRPVHGLAWASVAALAGFNCTVMAGSASLLAPVTWGLQRAVPLVFAVLAAVAAAAHWRADLVDARRRLRAFVVVTGVAYTVVMLMARLAAPRGQLSGLASLLDSAALLMMVSVVAGHLMRLGNSALFPSSLGQGAMGGVAPAPVQSGEPAQHRRCDQAGGFTPIPTFPLAGGRGQPPATAPVAADDRQADALQQALRRLMTEQHAYRTEDLSITSLAAQLKVPEYRLRRLINQRLGHRNFNAFVNGYRLDEARAVLADPQRRHLPVLGIALDAGFQSIGPFNRAFKAATGRTPTEYRRDKLADS